MDAKKCISALAFACLFLLAPGAYAQSKSKKKSATPSDFQSRLWYGGGFLLGFSGGGNSSVFQFGLQPQAGYKIVEPLSVGPRLSLVFGSYKQSGYEAVNLFNTDVGGFLRFRAFQGFFIQGELSNEWYQNPVFYSNGTTDKESETRFNQRIGGGYNFAGGRGGAGSEICIMYNFAIANDIESYQNPMEYRFSFTWNF